jgi:hypothetical protein
VSSLAKVKVSRANGRKSRGPRSADGKVKSRINALKHGLVAITRKNPKIFAEIEPIAIAICGGATHPLLFEQALIIAENALVLCCVQTEYIAAIERHRDVGVTPLATGDLGFALAQAMLGRAKLTYNMLLEREAQRPAAENAARTDAPNTGSSETREPASKESKKHVSRGEPVLERDEFDAMRSAMPDLNRLERYRRRAWSRQRRAIRQFMEIQHAFLAGTMQLDLRVNEPPTTGKSASTANAQVQ